MARAFNGAVSLEQILESDAILQQALVEVLNEDAVTHNERAKEAEAQRIIAEMRTHG